mgnify:CR=1 FL=1
MDRNGADEAGREAADGESARRAAILEAAGCVFAEKGFEAATTLEIARLARVSKRDLYRLFDSKKGLAAALVAAHTETMTLDPRFGDPTDRETFLAILRAFGRRFLGEFLDPRRVGLYRLAIAEAPRSIQLSEALQAEGADRVRRTAVEFIRRAVGHGLVAPEDADLVMASYFDVLVGPLQIQLLMGVRTTLAAEEIAMRAERATEVAARLMRRA